VHTSLSVPESIGWAFVIAVLLAFLHLGAPHLRRLPGVPERATASFAGGLAVAYVFLHLLPELAEGNKAIGEALADVLQPTPLLDLAIFLVALVGFVAFYGLERLAAQHHGYTVPVRKPGDGNRPPAVSPPNATKTHSEPSPRESDVAAVQGTWDRRHRLARTGMYRVHLGSFMLYNALITYTMPVRLRTGISFAILFTIAMGLHFVITERGLQRHYPLEFARNGRLALAGSLIAGWASSLAFAPSSTLFVALITALLCGSILLNVFKEELPRTRDASFAWFLTGLTLYAALLAWLTAAGHPVS
jgi:hypothetical protein